LQLLCRLEPAWILTLVSFPYISQPEWNFGPQAFDFQLLIFEIFHAHWSSRAVHAVNIILEGFLWMVIIEVTFGAWGIAVTLALLGVQAWTFGDEMLAVVLIGIQTFFAIAFRLTLHHLPYPSIAVLFAAKIALFTLTLLRTCSHAFEPLAPNVPPRRGGLRRFLRSAWVRDDF
jgi:hypothetical protein